jgi:peptidyl-prolyl cis-trans isomerase A (cyclophilin A)
MVICFHTPNRAKAAQSKGSGFALILLCLSLAAAGQTTSKSSTSAAQKAPAKTAAAPAKAPTAVIHTTSGDMKCELFPDKAPKAVANFIGLAKGTKEWKDPAGKPVHGKPLYDGVIFHRTIPEFMIQTGDPTGTGSGDVGFEFADELHADLLFDQPGRLAMANRGPNTNSSQFFITEKEVPFLNPCLDPNGCMGGRRAPNSGYTIFGQCDADTVELVKKIARMPCAAGMTCDGRNSRPQNPVKITHIEILSGGKSAPAKPTAAQKPAAPIKPSTPPPASTPK